MNDELETILISEQEVGERLDKVLAKRFEKIGSRTYFQFLIKEQKVLLNGTPAKKRHLLKEGDEVEIEFVLTPELDMTPQNIPLDIVFEDSEIIVINKPAGMVVHPAPGNWSGTFVNALLYHCRNLGLASQNDLRPGIVHRLDKDTSGLLIAAKSSASQQRLIEMFSARRIHKEYLALCLGNPGHCEINASIGRHPIHRQMMAVFPEGGRNARTVCQTLAFDGKISLVKLVITTGRTHQIRVHMKHHGTPVLGDRLYGNQDVNKKFGIERQMLHAGMLRFEHPMSQEILEFRADPPADMNRLIRNLMKKG